jgi:hypothetical protein
MSSSGNAGAGAGAGAAGAEGGPAESPSMAAHGTEEAPAPGDYNDEFGDPTGYMSSAQVDAVTQATTTISRNAGSRSIQVAQRDEMVAAGVPGKLAGDLAVEAMRSGRSAPAGSLEESFGVKPDEIALSAVTFMGTGIGMVAGMFDQLADKAVAAGWDVQDPSGMDYGDTPQSTGGQGGPGVDMPAAPAPPQPAPAPPPTAPTAAPTAAPPAAAGPTAATGATATPLSAVGAASTRARRGGRTATIATSTLGVPGQATVARKTLLGS